MARKRSRRAIPTVSVVLRMNPDKVKKLDSLCRVNDRSRRQLLEILIDEAYLEHRADPSARITPL